MSIARTLKVLKKDVWMGPRNGYFIYAIVLPVFMTVLFQGVFGSLFAPKPRLGIVDEGASEITAEVARTEGIELTELDDDAELKEMVEQNDLDAGIVLESGFDEAVRAGERPELEFYLGGESLAENRIVLAVTTLDLIRDVEGTEAQVEVTETLLGEEDYLPLATRLIPLILFYALILAGLFVPAMSLVQEREDKTLDAVLVTPVQITEVIAAKGIFGTIFAMIVAAIALALNNALGNNPLALVLTLFVAGLMSVEIGLLYAAFSKDVTQLFAFVKGMGILIFAPVLWYIFPNWPEWSTYIQKAIPTYWIIDPIWEVAVREATLADIAGTILGAVIWCVVLAAGIVAASRKMMASLGVE